MRIQIFRIVLILILVGIMPLVSCSDGGSITSKDQFMLRKTLHHDGVEREYFVHVPGDTKTAAALPIVIALHGYTSTATGFEAAYGLNQHADKHGYIVVYPQGSHFNADVADGEKLLITSWNDLASNLPPKTDGPHCTDPNHEYPCPPECGECNQCGWTSCYDDVGFIERMLDSVQAEFSPDPERVYLLGVSNGGMMALRLGCNLSARFAAVVPIIAQLAPGYACGPKTDLPMLHLYGGTDNIVRYDGQPASDGFIYTTAADTAAIWAESMRCQSGPEPWDTHVSQIIGLKCTAYKDCAEEGSQVVSCMDPDQGHDWPGQRGGSRLRGCVTAAQYDSLPDQARCRPTSNEITDQGMDLIWDFMRQYRSGRNILRDKSGR